MKATRWSISLSRWLILGDAKEANDLCALAIEQARRRRTTELAAALGNSLYLLSIQGDVEQVRRTCNELQKLAEEKGFLMWLHQARFFLGWANAAGGDRGGLEMMEAAMDRFREAHELVEQSFFYGLLAESYLALDLPERALENVERGLELVAELGEKFFEAPLLRLQGSCLRGTGDEAAASEIAALFDRARAAGDPAGCGRVALRHELSASRSTPHPFPPHHFPPRPRNGGEGRGEGVSPPHLILGQPRAKASTPSP